METTITPTTALTPLADLLRDLAEERQRAEKAKLAQETIISEAMSSQSYKLAGITRNDAQARIDELTQTIKQRAVLMFDGKNKKPMPGIQIKEKSVAIITDDAAARKYALEEAPSYVNIDFAGLASLAKKLVGTPHELKFVSINTDVVAEIASNLSAYLPKSEE